MTLNYYFLANSVFDAGKPQDFVAISCNRQGFLLSFKEENCCFKRRSVGTVRQPQPIVSGEAITTKPLAPRIIFVPPVICNWKINKEPASGEE